MQIKIEHNIDVVLAKLSGQQRQVSYAAAVALTRTAAQIKAALPSELDRVFDRPTPFTKRGIYLRAARRDNLTAEVGFMDRQASYLRLQVQGGTRQPTARGIRLPGNVELNAFGNIPRGLTDKLKAAAKDGRLGAAVMRRLGVAALVVCQPALHKLPEQVTLLLGVLDLQQPAQGPLHHVVRDVRR